MIARLIGGLLVAAGVAWLAARRGQLTASGTGAAVVVGTLAVAAGWAWGLLLIGYFVASSALTSLGRRRKAERTTDTLPPSHQRTARQVIANGGLFAACALVGTMSHSPMLHLAAAGALAAAAADTWATEVGTLWGGAPRSVLTWRTVSPGLSGGVTPAGLAASAVAGLAVAATTPWILPWPDLRGVVPVVALAGLSGSVADSLLGAAVQARHRCDRCGRLTERPDHCGIPTRHAAGWRWMTNDAVNLLATAVGALVAAALAPTMP